MIRPPHVGREPEPPVTDFRKSSVSLVLTVRDDAPPASMLASAGERLAALFADAEIVIVANGCTPKTGVELRQLAEAVPDLTIQFLVEAADRDNALLVGIANAIGDFVIVLDELGDLDDLLPAFLQSAAKGHEVVLALGEGGERPGWPERLYIKAYNALSGGRALAAAPVARFYSRDAALHLLQSNSAEMLLRSPEVATGFSGTTLQARRGRRGGRRAFRSSAAKGVRLLLSSSALPLRILTSFGVTGALVALVYSAYVLAIYLFSPNVAPGWTTMSLLLAFMLFLFSVMFALLAEYIVLIQRASGVQRRIPVAREVRSPLSRRTGRINVVDPEGQFHLGAVPPPETGHA